MGEGQRTGAMFESNLQLWVKAYGPLKASSICWRVSFFYSISSHMVVVIYSVSSQMTGVPSVWIGWVSFFFFF